jgi:hypothetical protein
VGTTYHYGALEIAPLFSGVLVYQFDQLHIMIFLVTCCHVLYDFRVCKWIIRGRNSKDTHKGKKKKNKKTKTMIDKTSQDKTQSNMSFIKQRG